MRFFSNDARETPDRVTPGDEAPADERPERVTSEPVAVPVQRPATSPWAAGHGTTPERDTGRPTETAPARADTASGPVAGRPPFHEPGAQPTTFGAATVGGAVAASAMADPVNDLQDDTDRRTDAASGVADDRTMAPGDGSRSDGIRSDGSRSDGIRSDGIRSDGPRGGGDDIADRRQRVAAAPRPRESDPVDAALGDGGTFADPVVVKAPLGQHAVARPSSDARTAVIPSRVEAGRHDTGRTGLDGAPIAVPADRGGTDRNATDRNGADRNGADRNATERSGTDRDGTERSVTDRDAGKRDAPDRLVAPEPSAGGQPAGGAMQGSLPGTVPAPELGPLFADPEAHSFRDRWRDVQLHFVDDPKAAADDAAVLIDEAVDALAVSLKSQREQLTGAATANSLGDTEQLRVRLRSYRDFLDRLLDL